MNKTLKTLLISTGALVLAGTASAAIATGVNLVANGGFENGTLNSGSNPGDDYYTALDDWFEQGGAADTNEVGELDTPTNTPNTSGDYWGNVKSLNKTSSIYQNLGTWNTGDETTFNLNMSIGSRDPNGNTARLYGGFGIELWGGSGSPEPSEGDWDTTNLIVLASSGYETVDTLGQSSTAAWTDTYIQSYDISTLVEDGDNIWLRIRVNASNNDYTGGTNVAGQSLFDEVSVVAIPEPSTIVLVGILLGACALFRRRR